MILLNDKGQSILFGFVSKSSMPIIPCEYSAPERTQQVKVSQLFRMPDLYAADIYSLGVILYELVYR